MKKFVNFEELRNANEVEKTLFFAGATTKDLHTIFNNEGYARYSKLKKAEKVQAILTLMDDPEAVLTFPINNYETTTIVKKAPKQPKKELTPDQKASKEFLSKNNKAEDKSQKTYFKNLFENTTGDFSDKFAKVKKEYDNLMRIYENKKSLIGRVKRALNNFNMDLVNGLVKVDLVDSLTQTV